MRMFFLRLPILRLIAVLSLCAVLSVSSRGANMTKIAINTRGQKQVIHSFGASDCWSCQFVGRYWPLPKRKRIADLLFSMDTDSKGNPKGIGLSMWRFNVGAGSAEQGNASGISTDWHRAECFQNPDGSYDWTKQRGQQWFLQAAQQRGVPYLLAFSISPPVQFTLNGIAHSDPGRRTMNIRDGKLPDFARFLSDVTEHFHKKGITLDYISPVNEPQWGWDNEKQEGTPASNAEIAELSRLIAKELKGRGLPSRVVVAEAGSLDFLTDRKGEVSGDQIKEFWNPSSPCYLGGTGGIARIISGHSYFRTWPVEKQIQTNERIRQRIQEIDPKLAFWQTEYCILESNDEIGHGWGRDLGMDTALYVARVIHNDLAIANATHWAWWLAVSPADYKDGLVYLDFADEYQPGNRPQWWGFEPLKRNGRVLPSKLLWTLGNFSRFVRPGMVRVGVSYVDNRFPLEGPNRLMVSAYLDKKTKQIVIVAINCTTEPQRVEIASLKVRGDTFASYTTSETSDLRKGAMPADNVSIPPRTVVTLVGTLK